MSLFGKKKHDGEPFDVVNPLPQSQGASGGTRAGSTTRAPEPTPSGGYGIDDAIMLLRKLPQDNVELVVRVVRTTLESVKIHVYEIVRAAGERLQSLDAKITAEKARIADLETEILARQTEIKRLQAQFDETEAVKEKLILAEEAADEDYQRSARGEMDVIELKKK